MKKSPMPDWLGPVVELLKGLRNEFLILTGVVFVLLTVWAFAAPQALQQFWGLFVFFSLLAFLAFVLALFAPALSERLKPQAEPPPQAPPVEPPPEEDEAPCDLPLTPDEQRTCYLDSLIAEHRRMRLAGLDPAASDATRGGMSLEGLYVSLDTQTRVRQKEREHEKDDVLRTADRDRPLPALEALAKAEDGRMVLLGLPGAGKSTFVRFVTLNMAEVLRHPTLALDERLPDWQGGPLLPVVISLGRLAEGLKADADRGTAEMVENFLRRTCDADDRLEGYGRRLLEELRERGGLVCFDGLDEVADLDLRPIVRQAVEAFAARYGRHAETRFLITCRTFSYTDPGWQLTAWETHELASFTPEQIHDFVDAWYTELNRIDPAREAENERKRARLHAALQSDDPRRLLEIADNPLILTVMAVVHGHRELPDSRAQVYKECVDLLVNRWELERTPQEEDVRKESLLEALDVPHITLQRALQDLAYHAHESGERVPDGEQVKSALVTEGLVTDALQMYFDDLDKVQTFLDYAEGANGLLMYYGRAPLPDAPADAPLRRVYVFPHLTFEEYLAGRYLERLSNMGRKVREHLDRSDRWREPVLMLGEYLCFDRGDFEKLDALLNRLVPRTPPAEPGDEDWRAVWVAGDLLMLYRRALQKRPQGDKRVVNRLAALVEAGALTPRERAAAGRTLARLDDPRPGVVTHPGMGVPDLVWCRVPAGPFVMGSAKEEGVTLEHPKTGAPIPVPPDPQASGRETPAHVQNVPYDYWISRYPVTNAQFAAFEADPAGYANPNWWTRAGLAWRGDRTAHQPYGGVFDLPNHPVVNVTWYEAVAFSRWLKDKLHVAGSKLKVWQPHGDLSTFDLQRSAFNLRLPFEAEWEKAARGGLTLSSIQYPASSIQYQASSIQNRIRRYPWGETPEQDRLTPEHANYDQTGINATSAVGAFPLGRSPYGVLDLSGNVWEWCQTRWVDNYKDYDKTEDNDEEGESRRVVRGGAFFNFEGLVRCAYRLRDIPNVVLRFQGFRVVAVPIDAGR